MSLVAQLAQRQLDAYNAHDLEAFLTCYAEDVVIRRLTTGEVMLTGREAMRQTYGALFEPKTVHASLVGRLVVGDVAVDQERVTGHPRGIVHALAHYQVVGDHIAQVWFVSTVEPTEPPT